MNADTYSLRGLTVNFISKTTTFNICPQSTKNYERYMNINYSSWKNGKMIDWENLIKINITRGFIKPRPNTWWNLSTGDSAWRRVIFLKEIDCAEFMRERFTKNSDWRRINVWIYGVRNKPQIFTWPGLFWNQTLCRWCRCLFN